METAKEGQDDNKWRIISSACPQTLHNREGMLLFIILASYTTATAVFCTLETSESSYRETVLELLAATTTTAIATANATIAILYYYTPKA